VNLVSVLLRHAQERPDAVALVDEDGATTTFAELEGAAAATAGSFRALGVTPGDRVAIAAWNDAGFVHAYLGALWAGAVAVPMNPSSPAAAHDGELRRVGARVLVAHLHPGSADVGCDDPRPPLASRARARERRPPR